MEHDQPSRTAQGAAMHRAAHQLIDRPAVFDDPLALRIIGEEAAHALRENRHEVLTRPRGLRAFIAARSRFTEDCLIAATARGTRQYVLLGAGLDTSAYRLCGEGLRVFEVDHPATQGWKRRRLGEAGIAIPERVTYAPVDFERETLHEGLAHAGFDFAASAIFAWLGVTPYLTRAAIMATLSFIASLATDSEVVFDYAEDSQAQDERRREQFDALAARVASAGEPFRSTFETGPLLEEVAKLGYSMVEDLDADALNARYFAGRTDGLRLEGRGHLLHARV